MKDTEVGIKNIRDGLVATRSVSTRNYILDPDDPNYNPCAIQHIIGANPQLCKDYDDPCSKPRGLTVQPILKTLFAQGQGFNNLLEDRNCSTSFNGKVPAGCVAVAVAQVMAY